MQRLFFALLIILSMIFTALYFYSVPVIKKKVFDIELTSSRIVLDSVFSLANKMYFDTEKLRSQALNSHKQQLQAVVELAESYLDTEYEKARNQGKTEQQARQQAFDTIRKLKYGSNDYIWISDYNSVILSHPDPRYHGQDVSERLSNDGEAAIPTMVKIALDQGQGFHQYQWFRLDAERQQDKVSFVKNYPQWGIVIGSGVYLDDLEGDIARIRKEAIQELREGLKEIRIASSGYLFIFDADTNMLVHPNPNIDGKNFLDLISPSTGNPIAKDLIQVADTGTELSYKWDRPDDPGNYIYDKLSLVRYLPGFDWYIGSSVYVDELRSSSELLAERILTIAIIALVIALILLLLFSQWVTRPIKQLAETAVKVTEGDLSAKSGIRSDDEMGLLARTFDDMVDRLRDNINNLDSKVEHRTQVLAEKNLELQDASRKMANAKQALALSEQRQRLILDALPAQIVFTDSDMNILFVNQRFADRVQRDKTAVINRPLHKMISPKIFSAISKQLDEAQPGEPSIVEYKDIRDNKELIFKRTLIPFCNADNSVNGILILAIDITAEKDALRHLNEAQRMNAVGQMAGGLAHDFNNLLTIILGNLYSAGDHYRHDDELTRYLDPAIRATRRGADITSRLLSFSRRQPLSPCLIDLETLMNETLQLLSNSLPDKIKIDFINSTDALSPFADPGRLEDALVNLAFNARDAMPDGGELRFSACNLEVDSLLVMDEQVNPGNYIQISISDTGCGFSTLAQEQAFEPFFTTKTGGAGSGLGLSMVYGFVKQSKGYISIENELSQGATIRLLLPARSEAAVIPELVEAETDHPQQASGKLVLLVEDDHDVRAIIRQQLIDMEFDVIDTHSADEAVRLIPLLPELYALVSDIMLPGELNGIQLADWLKPQDSQCRIVLISGYSYQQSEGTPIDPAYTLLNKPFAAAELKQAISRATRVL
ncbi:HAMP domain-containing protein [Amphritea balenae]|uniref:histidine kinase n=2 Tax=Amphritea balenae TaxID=452629 RepID=A0A3P1SXJ8_9GAMM|nr:HAMP domain-containing protein [Amphritea balenae]